MNEAIRDGQAVRAELRRLAEIAAGILDGEEVKRIITDKAMHYIAQPDPQHRFLSGDYFDVDHERFLRTKKLLLRIARLGRLEVSSSVWVPVPGSDLVTVAVHNGVHHRYYTFGQEGLPAPAEMKHVLRTGRICDVEAGEGRPALLTVLAPVRDSLGDVVAVAELTAPSGADPPPAWS